MNSAVLEEAGTTSVVVITGDGAKKRAIHTGYAEGGNIEVLDGIDDNDEIVFVGHTNLKDGSKVAVIEPTTPGLAVSADPSSGGIAN